MRENTCMDSCFKEAPIRLDGFRADLYLGILLRHKYLGGQWDRERFQRLEGENLVDNDYQLVAVDTCKLPQLLLRSHPLLSSVGKFHLDHFQQLPVLHPPPKEAIVIKSFDFQKNQLIK